MFGIPLKFRSGWLMRYTLFLAWALKGFPVTRGGFRMFHGPASSLSLDIMEIIGINDFILSAYGSTPQK